VVYGTNPCTPLVLTPICSSTKFIWEVDKRLKEIQELHAKGRERIEKFNEHNKIQANKHRRDVQFKPGDLVWIHLRNERFLSKRRSKLLPRSNGPSEVLEKINPSAYKVDLLGEYGVSATFNVADLRLYLDEDDDLRNLTNLSKLREMMGITPRSCL